jgi:hypothetical protein
MIAQRPAGAAPAVRAVAEALPFGRHQFDAAMALWTIHHWADPGQGIVVIVAASERLNQLWLTRDYFPAMTRARRPEIQPERIAALLGGSVRIEPFLVPRDCLDGFAEAFWARPEAYLDPRVRAGMSAGSSMRRRSALAFSSFRPTSDPGPGTSATGISGSLENSTADSG